MDKKQQRKLPTYKIGPAKHAVVAIVDKPLFDNVTLATRSCIELPNARTVRPNTVLGILNNTPNSSSSSTSLSAMESSHVAETANP